MSFCSYWMADNGDIIEFSDMQSRVIFLTMETPQSHYTKTPEPWFNCSNMPAVQQVPQIKWMNPGGGLVIRDNEGLSLWVPGVLLHFACVRPDSTWWSSLPGKLSPGTTGCHNIDRARQPLKPEYDWTMPYHSIQRYGLYCMSVITSTKPQRQIKDLLFSMWQRPIEFVI